MTKKLLLKFFLIFLFLSAQLTKGQSYTPLVITSGFNEDVIAEDSPASTYTTSAVDATSSGANNAFMSTNYPNATVGLPANGLITSIATGTPGLTFQLAPYNQNNSLKINANNGTGTLAVQTTNKLIKLFLLTTSGSSPSTFTGTITFTDATTQTFTSQSVPDWYDQGTPAITIRGIGRVPRTGTQNPDNNTTNPKLFQVAIDISSDNQNKIIQQVALTKTSSTSGFLHIFALSGEITPTCFKPENLGIQNLTATSVDLTWTSAGNTFDIKWGQRGFNVATAGTLVTGFANGGTLSGLTADMDYDYYVRRDCGAVDGVSAWAGPFQFRTGYCIPTGAGNNGDEIRNFKLSNLNNNSNASEGTAGYKDYSGTVEPAILEIGGAYIASLTSGTGTGNHGAAIWIDYNNNLVFEANEKVSVIASTITASTTANFPSFTVPATVQPGIYRLRVQYHYLKGGADLDPCSLTSTYGETEDYAVQIIPAPTCFPPLNIKAKRITKNSVQVVWDAPILGTPPALGYKIEVRTSGRPGDATGLVRTLTTTNLSETLTGLNSETEYLIYVQSLCAATDESTWGRISFTTLCEHPDYELTTSATDLSFCGSREVTLTVDTQGIVNWYNSQTSTTPIHTGNTYTTTVSATSSFWYEVVSEETTTTIPTGPLNAEAVSTSSGNWASEYDVYFTVLKATTLRSIDIYPTTAGQTGSMTFKQRGATGSATVGTINYTTVGEGRTEKQVVPINIQLVPGTYAITTSLPSSGLMRNTGGASYPYSSEIASITGNGFLSSYYMGYYNWLFETPCKSLREEVVVTVIEPQIITNAVVDPTAAEGSTLHIASTAELFTIEYGLTGFERGEGTSISDIEHPYVFQSLRAHTTYDVYVQALPCGIWYGPVTFTTEEATDTQVITATDVVKNYGDEAFTHGESDSGLPLSYTIENENIAIVENGELVIKGAGTTRVTVSQEGDSQYLPAEDVIFTLTVNKALLTVTADSDQQKEYGETDPTLTYTVEGFKYEDNQSVLLNGLSRNPGENLGIYPITQGNLQGGSNYTITFVGATFEITKATLTVSADALTKLYGDADPVLTYTVAGARFNDDQIVAGQLARETGENVGTYTINQGGLHIINPNYVLVYEENQFRIDPAILTINPTAGLFKTYGAVDPVLTFIATGFKFNDTQETTLNGVIERVAGENVGLYAYEQGSLSSALGNYTFMILNDSKFEIKPAPITVHVNENQQKTFGQADPLLTYTIEGLQRGEQQSQVMSGRLARQAGEAIGLYPIEQGTLAPRNNYNIETFVSADFEIVSGTITGLSLPSRTVVYDGTAKSLEVQGNIPEDAVITYTNNNQVQVGVYNVTARIDFGPNYDLLTLQAVLTIVKADQVIDFEPPVTVLLEDTPTLQLVATASSSLPVSFSIDYAEDREIATVTESGLITFLRPGFVTVTARQAGNENYNAAAAVSRTIEVVSKNTDILNLIVDGVSYGRVEKEVLVTIGCESQQKSVLIEVETTEGTIVTPGKNIVVEVPEYGQYEQMIKVQSAYRTSETYKVIIDKRIPTDKIVYQKYNNVLLVNNNKQTNTGYVFTAYQWFKNGEGIGTGQSYSAGTNYGDALEIGATYHVELTLLNGKKITSCPIYIEVPTSSKLAVYPNPVKRNQRLHVQFDQTIQETSSYVIYDLKGQMIQRGELQRGNSSIDLPATVASGSYFLVLKTDNGQQNVQFIVRE